MRKLSVAVQSMNCRGLQCTVLLMLLGIVSLMPVLHCAVRSVHADGPNDTCRERRVFYRLISGFHMSITVHVSTSFLHDNKSGEVRTLLALSGSLRRASGRGHLSR